MAVTAGLLLSGCGSYARSVSHREVLVVFVATKTPADVERVRSKCDGIAGAKAVLAAQSNAGNRRYPLRFDVTGVDVRGRAKLGVCLSSDPAVRGYVESDPESGG